MGNIAYRNILVPIDETDMSKRAIDHALHVAKNENGKLILVHVESTHGLEAVYPKDLSEKMTEFMKKSIRSNIEYAKRYAKDVGIEVQTDILTGEDVGSDLIRVAEERKVDLTVMGTESLRTNPIGSLTRWIIAADIGPVLVITSED
ncbi:MAG: universal stress protein [Euryarchaeota archaeon]|nr:universal stress protein [Euryarchaeota archaeon]